MLTPAVAIHIVLVRLMKFLQAYTEIKDEGNQDWGNLRDTLYSQGRDSNSTYKSLVGQASTGSDTSPLYEAVLRWKS